MVRLTIEKLRALSSSEIGKKVLMPSKRVLRTLKMRQQIKIYKV
jgi:hypothetical protein